MVKDSRTPSAGCGRSPSGRGHGVGRGRRGAPAPTANARPGGTTGQAAGDRNGLQHFKTYSAICGGGRRMSAGPVVRDRHPQRWMTRRPAESLLARLGHGRGGRRPMRCARRLCSGGQHRRVGFARAGWRMKTPRACLLLDEPDQCFSTRRAGSPGRCSDVISLALAHSRRGVGTMIMPTQPNSGVRQRGRWTGWVSWADGPRFVEE